MIEQSAFTKKVVEDNPDTQKETQAGERRKILRIFAYSRGCRKWNWAKIGNVIYLTITSRAEA